jgi:hypothetical protein
VKVPHIDLICLQCFQTSREVCLRRSGKCVHPPSGSSLLGSCRPAVGQYIGSITIPRFCQSRSPRNPSECLNRRNVMCRFHCGRSLG